jgi:hypothetical protein
MTVYGYIDAETHEYRQEARETPPDMHLCDFCSSNEIFKMYPNRQTVEMMPGIIDSGGWAACRTCADLIDAERWQDLCQRSADTFMEIYGFPKHERPTIEAAMNEIHRGFRENRGLEN